MIKSYQDYLTYLEADRRALKRDKTLKSLLFDDIWKFQRLLRKLEYQINCQPRNPLRFLTSFRYKRLGRQLGFSIPIDVFGPGLSIAHSGTIVVHHDAKIGANCRLHVCVNIGAQAGKPNEVPQIGDNCYIGPGAKIFGAVILGDNMAIGANAVVNKSFPEGNCTIGGVPAKKISDKTSEGLLIKAFPLEKVEV
jgi:serine O-acetyltransferase